MYFLFTFVCLHVRVWCARVRGGASEGADVRGWWRRISLSTPKLKIALSLDYTAPRMMLVGSRAPQQLDPIQLRAACSPRRRFHRERSDTAAGVHTRPWKAERRVVGPSQRPPRRIELDGEYIPSLHHTLRELFRITSSGAYRTTVTRLWLVWDRKRK